MRCFKLLIFLFIGLFLIGCSSSDNSTNNTSYTPPLQPEVFSVINDKNTQEGTYNTKFTLKGNNFTKNVFVLLINGLGFFYVPPTSITQDTIEFIIPNTIVAEQFFSVCVENAGIISTPNESCVLNIVSPQLPQILSIDKTADITDKSERLTIYGKNFRDKGEVFFKNATDEIKAESIKWTDSEIIVQIPSSIAQDKPYDIYIETVAGRNKHSLIYTYISSSDDGMVMTSAKEIGIENEANSVLISCTPTLDSEEFETVSMDGYPINTLYEINPFIRLVLETEHVPGASGNYVTISSPANNMKNKVKAYLCEKPTAMYALFIGISNYKKVNSLINPHKDAKDVQSAIMNPSKYHLWNMDAVKYNKILTNYEATKVNIIKAIEDLSEKVNEDEEFDKTVFIFYSGHGTNDGDKTYICPADVTVSDLSTAISDTELLELLKTMPSYVKKIIVMDSCHSGGFIGKAPSSSLAKSIYVPGMVTNFKGDGFKQIASIPNLIFGSASRSDQLSWDSYDLKNGYFAYYFLEAIGRNPEILGKAVNAAPSNKNINIEKALWYAQISAAKATASKSIRQDAQIFNNYSVGDMPFKGNWDRSILE